jgi:hypothetical protein
MKLILLIFSVLSVSVFAVPPPILVKKTNILSITTPEISFEGRSKMRLNILLKYVFGTVTGSTENASYEKLFEIISAWDVSKIEILSQHTIDYMKKNGGLDPFHTKVSFYTYAIPYFLIIALEDLKETFSKDTELISILEARLTAVKKSLYKRKISILP